MPKAKPEEPTYVEVKSQEQLMYEGYVKGKRITDIAFEFKVGTQEVLEAIQAIEQSR